MLCISLLYYEKYDLIPHMRIALQCMECFHLSEGHLELPEERNIGGLFLDSKNESWQSEWHLFTFSPFFSAPPELCDCGMLSSGVSQTLHDRARSIVHQKI